MNQHEQIQKNTFNRAASILSSSYRVTRNHTRKLAKALEPLVQKQKSPLQILEIGVGTGVHASWINTHHPMIEYHGIDIAHSLLSVCHDRLEQEKKVHLYTCSGESLPFHDKSFDHVFMVSTLHHMEHPQRCVSEAGRVLKQGGTLAIVEPNRIFPTNIKQMILYPSVEKNVRLMTKQNFLKWFRSAGLSNAEVTPLLYTPPVPQLFSPLYDRLDSLIYKIPLLRWGSIMITGCAIKPR